MMGPHAKKYRQKRGGPEYDSEQVANRAGVCRSCALNRLKKWVKNKELTEKYLFKPPKKEQQEWGRVSSKKPDWNGELLGLGPRKKIEDIPGPGMWEE